MSFEQQFRIWVKKNEDKIDWGYLSANPNITWDIVKNNTDKHWKWCWLSANPNITWNIVENNPDKDWDWYWLSANPNITWDILINNPDKDWDWRGISQNPFTKQREIIEKENAIRLIQNKWKDALVDPNLRLGRKKIFENMQSDLGEEPVEYTDDLDEEMKGYTERSN